MLKFDIDKPLSKADLDAAHAWLDGQRQRHRWFSAANTCFLIALSILMLTAHAWLSPELRTVDSLRSALDMPWHTLSLLGVSIMLLVAIIAIWIADPSLNWHQIACEAERLSEGNNPTELTALLQIAASWPAAQAYIDALSAEGRKLTLLEVRGLKEAYKDRVRADGVAVAESVLYRHSNGASTC